MRPHRWQPTRPPHPWDSPSKDTGMGCHFLLQCMKVKSESEVAQSCPTLSDPMDCSLPGSSVLGIFQARVLEWGAIAFSAVPFYLGSFYWWLSGKESACQCRRKCGLNTWVGMIPWRRQANPLQYSYLGNPTDRGAWRATVHGFTKGRAPLSDQTTTTTLLKRIPSVVSNE